MKKAFIILIFFYSIGLCAQDNAAMLSDQCRYLGNKVLLAPGAYRAYQLGIGDNRLSSFHLPSGMAMQAFDFDNFQGRSEIFYSSSSCLPANWNNRVSSLKIFWMRDPGNGSGNPGIVLPPQGNNVILYKDMRYSGMSKEVGVGNFSAATLGFLQNNISSIYIPSGHVVRVTDRAGRSQAFTSSVANLAQYGWDNAITSGIIQGNYNGGGNGGGVIPPQGDRVIFYRDMKFTGMARDFGRGAFNASGLGFLADNISSIYIPPGQSVKVYARNNSSRVFTASVANLSQYGWDNKIYTGIITETGGGGGAPPQGDRVIFYRDMKYSGMAKDFNQGNFGSGSLGFLSENISSIYIPYGWAVRVNSRNGRTQTFTASMSSLAQYGWDNAIYSGFITANGNGGEHGGNGGGNSAVVTLFTDLNYRGNATPCGQGSIGYIGAGADNRISSIQLAAGYAITVYDGQNLTGPNRTFTGSVNNLAIYGWNRRITSVYVFRQ